MKVRVISDEISGLKDLVAYVHLKNCISEKEAKRKRSASLSQGEIPIYEQIRSIREDSYRKFISLETHLRPKVKKTKENGKPFLKSSKRWEKKSNNQFLPIRNTKLYSIDRVRNKIRLE